MGVLLKFFAACHISVRGRNLGGYPHSYPLFLGISLPPGLPAARDRDSLPGARLRAWSLRDWPSAPFQATLALRRPGAIQSPLEGGFVACFKPILLGASWPVSRQSVLTACTARMRRRVTRGTQNARAAALSGVARVLAFGCGPRQPPLRPCLSLKPPCSSTARAMQARRITN